MSGEITGQLRMDLELGLGFLKNLKLKTVTVSDQPNKSVFDFDQVVVTIHSDELIEFSGPIYRASLKRYEYEVPGQFVEKAISRLRFIDENVAYLTAKPFRSPEN